MKKTAPAVLPPVSLPELLARAEALAGRSLGELAVELGSVAPADLRRAKGWVGELVEAALGASAGSRAEPDFPALGVELKTLPIDATGKPLESTFVCTIALRDLADVEFEGSVLWKKLSQVLWIPVHAERSVPVAERRIASPVFWRPSQQQRDLLQRDWEAAASLISRGRTSEITGHSGRVLQVRPKAARGSSRRRAYDDEGALYDEQPKGFYLRPALTHQILRDYFG
jgi:DNA mismatch repair protein MutH